jgi:hypothetical protein
MEVVEATGQIEQVLVCHPAARSHRDAHVEVLARVAHLREEVERLLPGGQIGRSQLLGRLIPQIDERWLTRSTSTCERGRGRPSTGPPVSPVSGELRQINVHGFRPLL